MEKYKEKKKLKTVLALCFTSKAETFHHWKVFANNSAGVCVRFNKDNLLASFNKIYGIKYDYVTYRSMRYLKSNPPSSADELPFLKRKQYRDEKEFRIIYKNKNKEHKVKYLTIDLQSIERITLSPWIPLPVSKTVKKVICNIDGCNLIQLLKTGMVEHKVWKNIAEDIK